MKQKKYWLTIMELLSFNLEHDTFQAVDSHQQSYLELRKKILLSELIGLEADEQPLYNVFPLNIKDMPIDKQEEAISFVSKTS